MTLFFSGDFGPKFLDQEGSIFERLKDQNVTSVLYNGTSPKTLETYVVSKNGRA